VTRRALVRIIVLAWAQYAALFAYTTRAMYRNTESKVLAVWAYKMTDHTNRVAGLLLFSCIRALYREITK